MTYRVPVQPAPSFSQIKAPSGKVFIVLQLPKSRRNGVWVDPEEWVEIVSQWNAYVESFPPTKLNKETDVGQSKSL
jgi:hypothetical protein